MILYTFWGRLSIPLAHRGHDYDQRPWTAADGAVGDDQLHALIGIHDPNE